MYEQETRASLYVRGVDLAIKFLRRNRIPLPVFYDYANLLNGYVPPQHAWARSFVKRAAQGNLVGMGTGVYTRGYVCVNVAVTALPVQKPKMRNWSWPCYKVDRTSVGVVAHEVGHYVDEWLRKHDRDGGESYAWKALVESVVGCKAVSGYEPKPSEAWAETMRLFILNPHLLQRGCPARYMFLQEQSGLVPSEARTFKEVLGRHVSYVNAATNWIMK